MNNNSDGSTAAPEAGYGPPSNTGSSATELPGPSSARTCSRPPGEILKMRTRPLATMKKPVQASPSENINSEDAYERMSVRVARDANSALLSAENSAVPLKMSVMESLSVMRKSCLRWPRAHGADPLHHIAPRIALPSGAHRSRDTSRRSEVLSGATKLWPNRDKTSGMGILNRQDIPASVPKGPSSRQVAT